mgnify:FL=1
MRIQTLYIDQAVADQPLCETIAARLGLTPEPVTSPEAAYRYVAAASDPVAAGKRSLLLTRNKGAFIRPCPGTSYYTCCNYMILHIGTFCVMDCAYCILQSYFHPPLLQYYVNQSDMTAALDEVFAKGKIRRIGTGEFTDSLIWETADPISAKLIRKFAGQDQAILEIKSKSVQIAHLLDLPHNRKTIMAWSLNTEPVVAREERGTASLDARLRAASQCQDRGYPLAFHFDPLILYPGCETDYLAMLDRLFNTIDPSGIVWISLGSFRFMPDLKPIVQARFPASKMIYGEFIKGLDGKMRYFKPQRLALYRRLVGRIQRDAPQVTAYFCMEDDEAWQQAFGFTTAEKGGLPAMLDRAAVRHCGLRP